VSARDKFKRYTVKDLEKRPALHSRRLDPPLDLLVEDLKLEEHGYRYSIIRDTRVPANPPRVACRKFDGQRWAIIPMYSITYLIDPSERAAIDANEQALVSSHSCCFTRWSRA